MIAPRRRWFRASFIAAGVAGAALLAALSGFGVRYVKGTYEQVCDDEKTYLQAVDGGVLAEIAAGVDRLRADLSLFRSDTQRYLTKMVDAASSGDPSLARRDHRVNCEPVPSPTSPPPAAPASVSGTAASPSA